MARTLWTPCTRIRFGVMQCTEFLIDVPSYFGSFNGSQPSGFSNLVVSLKRQLTVPFGFDLSATGGVGFPTGAPKTSGRGYQLPSVWSRALAPSWQLAGMFTLFWSPSESSQNLVFQPTLSLEKELGPAADVFLEYVGDYDHQPPAHLLDGGWRLAFHQISADRFSCRRWPQSQLTRSQRCTGRAIFRHRVFHSSRSSTRRTKGWKRFLSDL